MRIPMPGKRAASVCAEAEGVCEAQRGERMMASRALAIWYDDIGAERHGVADKGSVVQGPN